MSEFTSDQKHMAMFTVVTALARALAGSGALDRNIWLAELTAARAWLERNGDASLPAYDAMMEMLSDI